MITKTIILILIGLSASGKEVSWKVFSSYNSKKNELSKELKNVVGKNISVKGYMIPLDYSKKFVTEFLLVPYIPSCSHVPPPPAKMIINITMAENNKFKTSYYPIEVKGRLKVAKKSKRKDPYLPNGIFSIKASKIKELKY